MAWRLRRKSRPDCRGMLAWGHCILPWEGWKIKATSNRMRARQRRNGRVGRRSIFKLLHWVKGHGVYKGYKKSALAGDSEGCFEIEVEYVCMNNKQSPPPLFLRFFRWYCDPKL